MGIEEMVLKQEDIIRIQSGIIDELFRMLVQHVEIDELDKNGTLGCIGMAACKRRELGE